MVYLHNNAIMQGKPRYEIKLNNLKLSTSDEQYINNRFQFLKHKEYDKQNNTVTIRHIQIPSKSIKI